LKINTSSANQGIKLTSFARFTPDTTNPWYRLRVTYYSDSPSIGQEILPVILLYPNNSSNVIRELGASFTGNGLILADGWHTLDAFVYCHASSGQIQVIIKNKTITGSFYIDSIQLDNLAPDGFINST